MKLQDRFNILRNGGVIDRETHEVLPKIYEQIEGHNYLPIHDDNGAGLMVYIALMLMRFKRNEVSAPMSEELFEEFRSHKMMYRTAKDIIEDIELFIGINIPESEQQYLIANIFTILDPDGPKLK
jgi:transcriptional regulatory protein LevR